MAKDRTAPGRVLDKNIGESALCVGHPTQVSLYAKSAQCRLMQISVVVSAGGSNIAGAQSPLRDGDDGGCHLPA